MTEKMTPFRFPDYADGGVLTAADYRAEQEFQSQLQAAYNLSQRSAGVVRGLDVAVLADGSGVSVTPGVALDGTGRTLALDAAVTATIARVFANEALIVIGLVSRLTARRTFRKASGYTRVEARVEIRAVAGPKAANDEIVLARVTIGTDRLVSGIDFATRQVSGVTLGHLGFPRPNLAESEWAAIRPDQKSGALEITAPRVDVFGDAAVLGKMQVGSGAAPLAQLTVRAPDGIDAATPVSSDGVSLYSSVVGGLSNLAIGDRLDVDLAGHLLDDATAAAATETFTVTGLLGPSAVSVSPKPPGSFAGAPYRYRKASVLRILDGRGRLAFRAALDGRVAIGASSARAEFAVAGGDLRISDGKALAFAEDGAVTSGGGRFSVGWAKIGTPKAAPPAGKQKAAASPLSVATNSLTLHSDEDIALFTGDHGPNDPPDMIVTRAGKVGLGIANPSYALSVDGTIRTGKGLVFPDKTKQTKTVIPIPIGTIVDWWRPKGFPEFAVDGFQICDGSAITDPASPLAGKTTPNLSNRLVRGEINFEQMGKTGGSATHTHKFAVPTHSHSMSHNHRVTGTTGATSATAGDDIAGDSIAPLGHVHDIDLTSYGPAPGETGTNLKPLAGETGPGSSLPKRMYVLKVMRIK